MNTHQPDNKNAPISLHTGRSFLVADDNFFMCDIIKTYLSSHGAEVDTVENGKLALDKYLEAPDKYDFIILDMKMPTMEGEEAAEYIKANPPSSGRFIPIIAMSGEVESTSDLFSGFLPKPFALIELERLIEKLRLSFSE